MIAERILVVFYSTSCPHCQTMIPKLSELVKGRGIPGLAVVAVSLDNNPGDWLSYVRRNAFVWTDVIDTQGWGGQAAAGYYVYATPTMFLLGNGKKIIGKPLNIEELAKLL